MTDQVNLDSSTSLQSDPSTIASFSSNPSSTPASAAEEMISKQYANDLLHSRTKESREKGYAQGYKDAELKFQSSYQPQVQPQAPQQPAFNKQEFLSELKDELRKESEEQAARAYYAKIGNEFSQKLVAAESKFGSDFASKVDSLKLGNMLPIVELTNLVDNTADIINDLAENPHKAAELMTIYERTPHLAPAVMQKYSEAVKQNQQALSRPQERPPLSQIKPSTVSADSGPMTINDWKNDPFLRG